MLALALAYNDLKGMALFEQYITAMGRPSIEDWSVCAGQWRGVAVQIHRWLAGVLHEVMVVLHNNRDLLRSREVTALLESLPPASQSAWKEIFDAARDTSGNTSTLLLRIRNNAAFHYGPRDLGLGFKRQFVDNAKANPHVANLTAQYSVGPDMDGTRFFFADAAAQQRMIMLGIEFGAPETDRRVVELAERMNQALVPLVGAFLAARRAS